MKDRPDDDCAKRHLLVNDLLSGLITHEHEIGPIGTDLIELLRAAGYHCSELEGEAIEPPFFAAMTRLFRVH